MVFNVNGKTIETKAKLVTVFEYNKFGKITSVKTESGYEIIREYDENGREIKSKNILGMEFFYEYDEKGNLVCVKNKNNDNVKIEYDENGKLIHKKNSDGAESFFYYDEKGNLIQEKHEGEKGLWYGENFYNKLIMRSPKKIATRTFYEYDENNNLIKKEDTNGNKAIWKYDGNGNCIYRKIGELEDFYKYDENDLEIHMKSSDGFEAFSEYDKNKRVIHEKRSIGKEFFFEYEFYEDGSVKTKKRYEAEIFKIKNDNINRNATLCFYNGKESVVEVPKGVTIIDSFSFADSDTTNYNIKKIILPDSVKKIKTNAFSNCNKLEEIKWPENSGFIVEENLFQNSPLMTNVSLPKNAKLVKAEDEKDKKKTTHLMMERIILVHKLIKKGVYPNTEQIRQHINKEFGLVMQQEQFSISTISRDLDFLRTRFNAPIKYDRNKNGYVYEDDFELKF